MEDDIGSRKGAENLSDAEGTRTRLNSRKYFFYFKRRTIPERQNKRIRWNSRKCFSYFKRRRIPKQQNKNKAEFKKVLLILQREKNARTTEQE